MRFQTYFHFLLACLVAVSITACDQSSQNLEFEDGSNLTVTGDSLVLPKYDSTGTAEYMVRAFTVEQDYEWSVDGATLDGTRRDGEVAVVSTDDPDAEFSVTVTTTIDGEEYSGTGSFGTIYPDAGDQLGTYELSTFSSARDATGILPSWSAGQTVFAPTDAAFLAALDENGDEQLQAGEMPSTGVLRSILQYHVVEDSLTSTEIADGAEEPTLLHPEETVTFNRNGSIEVNDTELSELDIATSEGVVIHGISDVLLPASVVAINDQTIDRDLVNDVDSVAVEGAYVADGGFIALHEASSGDIIGSSDLLSAGFHGNDGPIKIALDNQRSSDTDIVAMTHRDTNDDGSFTPALGVDAPYTRGDSNVPVTDTASVAAP